MTGAAGGVRLRAAWWLGVFFFSGGWAGFSGGPRCSDYRSSGMMPARKGFYRMVSGHFVVKQLPLRGRQPVLYWWAERGLVRYVREPDGEYGVLDPKTARMRAAHLWRLVGTSSGGDPEDERLRLARFLRQFEALVDLAESQGSPFAGEESFRHWKAKRPVSIVMPPSWERVEASQ